MGFGFAGLGALLTGGSVASATAKASGGDAKVFGTKPKVADFKPVDLMVEQKRAVDSNLANAADIDRLLNSILPGYTEMLAQGSKNTLSLLHGEVPDDVKDQVQRNSAYQSLIGGYAGTGMSKALSARDFGRTSLDMMTLGTNSAQLWERIASEARQPYQITTAGQAGVTAENNRGIQNTQQLKFNVAAAPDPAAAGKFGIDSALGMKLLSFGMGAAGGAIGGAGGAAGASAGTSTSGNPSGYTNYTGWGLG